MKGTWPVLCPGQRALPENLRVALWQERPRSSLEGSCPALLPPHFVSGAAWSSSRALPWPVPCVLHAIPPPDGHSGPESPLPLVNSVLTGRVVAAFPHGSFQVQESDSQPMARPSLGQRPVILGKWRHLILARWLVGGGGEVFREGAPGHTGHVRHPQEWAFQTRPQSPPTLQQGVITHPRDPQQRGL